MKKHTTDVKVWILKLHDDIYSVWKLPVKSDIRTPAVSGREPGESEMERDLCI